MLPNTVVVTAQLKMLAPLGKAVEHQNNNFPKDILKQQGSTHKNIYFVKGFPRKTRFEPCKQILLRTFATFKLENLKQIEYP